MTSRTQPHYYTNPAFSQQSEFYNGQRPQRALSPQRNIRQPPVGAQTPLRVVDNCATNIGRGNSGEYEEQEFYEEIIVDNEGIVKDKKFVVISQNNYGKKYIQLPQNDNQGSRYGAPQELNDHSYEEVRGSKDRYEYIPMKEQDTPKKCRDNSKVSPNKPQHRYAVIDAEEETELATKSTRYALVPVEQLESIQPATSKGRYEYIPDDSANRSFESCLDKIDPQDSRTLPRQLKRSQSQRQTRYEYIVPHSQRSPPYSPNRIEYVQSQQRVAIHHQRGGNPVATQKLHELLSTPRKPKLTTPSRQQILSPSSQRRVISSPLQQIQKDPFIISKPSPQKNSRVSTPKAHKKLNYAIGVQQSVQDKRYTAIVAPMCSSPVQSMYSETTFSNKSSSWGSLSLGRKPAQRIFFVAAALLVLCGTVSCGLSFFMIGVLGIDYYLNFAVASGFMCLTIGLTGFRSKRCSILPGSNLSGYILLSLFSLATCASLLIILFTRPKLGTPLGDIMSGVVVGLSLISFIVAVWGIICGYCTKNPPRDNRVEHCSPGFRV